MDLHRRQPIWLQHIWCLGHNNGQRTMWRHHKIMLEIHRAQTLNSGNPQINFFHHLGTVTRLRSHHFQALPSPTNRPHSTWHQARNQAQVQPKDIQVMGHVARIQLPPRRFWWTSNVPPSPIHRTGAVMSRYTSSTSSIASKQSSHLADSFSHDFALRTSWCVWETPREPLNAMFPVSYRTAWDKCCRDCGFATISRDFLWRSQCRLWGRWFVGPGRG